MEENNNQVKNKVIEILNNSIESFFSEIDHTTYYYELIKNEEVLKELIKLNIVHPIILFSLNAIDIIKNFTCKCGNNSFNYECPIVICKKCHNEYFLISNESLEVCKKCPSSNLGTCEIYPIIKKGLSNGYKNIILQIK